MIPGISNATTANATRLLDGFTPAQTKPQPQVSDFTAARNRDVAEFAPTAAPTPLPGGKPDLSYDGAFLGSGRTAYAPGTSLDTLPGYTPQDGRTPNETIVFVNGMGSGKGNAENLCQQVADKTGAKVVGIYNGTQGTLKDLVQCAEDTINVGNNPATKNLSDVIYDKMKSGQPLHLMGFSQGAIITSDAIKNAQDRMMKDGMTKDQVQARMHQLLKVETIAGGAHTFPDGPEYVHYVNNKDLVAESVGLGSHLTDVHPGAGAKVITFSDFGSFSFNPFQGHNFDKYMKRYQSFDSVYGK